MAFHRIRTLTIYEISQILNLVKQSNKSVLFTTRRFANLSGAERSGACTSAAFPTGLTNT
jgi:hypothetical protein